MIMRFILESSYFQSIKRLNYKQMAYKLGLLAILVYVFYVGISHLFRFNEYSQRYQRMCTQINIEEGKKAAWLIQLSKMENDDYWEWMARTQLGMLQKGERVYKVTKVGVDKKSK